MAPPARYTTRSILNGDVDLLGAEVRRANRQPGQHGWYREVLIKKVGAWWILTGRPVLTGAHASPPGALGARVEFSEGPAHQTYEVRDTEFADTYRQVVRAARDTVLQAIKMGSRIAVAETPGVVDELFWGELQALIKLIAADDELRAHEHDPTAAVLTWRPARGSKGGGHYAAAGPGIAYSARRDALASEANRWVLYRDGARISAHRLLKTAQRVALRDLHRQLHTRAAAAAAGVDQQRPAADPRLQHGRCWHGTNVELHPRATCAGGVRTSAPGPSGWWHPGSDTACDDPEPYLSPTT